MTNRPRIIGASSILAPGACALEEIEEGAAHRRCARRERRSSASTPGSPALQFGAHVEVDQRQRDQRRSPRPSERTTETVSAPGRWIAASAMRISTGAAPGAAPRDDGDGERDETQQRRRQQASRRRRRARSSAAGWSTTARTTSAAAGERGAGEIAARAASPAFLGEIAEQRRDRQVVRAAERQDRESERRQEADRRARARSTPGSIEGASGIGKRSANSPLTANGIAAPSAAPASGADQSRRPGTPTSASATTLRPGRPDRLQDRQRRPLAFDEALRGIGDADPADDQRQQARQRQEFGEASRSRVKSGETLRRVRVSQPASGNCAVRRRDKGLDGALARAARRDRRSRPGSSSAPAIPAGRARSRAAPPRRSAPAGPKPMPTARRSGSLDDDGAEDEFRRAEAKDVADLQIEPREQRLLRRRAENAVLLRERRGGRHRRRRARPRRSGATTARPP